MARFTCPFCGKEGIDNRHVRMCPQNPDRVASGSQASHQEETPPSLPFGLTEEQLANFAPRTKEILGISTLEKAVSLMMDRMEKQESVFSDKIAKNTEAINSLVKLAQQVTSSAPEDNPQSGIGGGVNRMLGQASMGDVSELIRSLREPTSAQQMMNLLGFGMKWFQLGIRMKEGVTPESVEKLITETFGQFGGEKK